jgi:uncharacterized membrane protein YedE/YeeE
MTARSALTALGAGLLFGAGLLVSGMTDPARIRAFLDFTGSWSPALAGVMGGAIAVHASALWLERRRQAAAPAPQAPIEARALVGAAVFGVGWGLGGFCPGPAIVSLGFTSLGLGASGVGPVTWIFFGAMVIGVLLGDAAAPVRADSAATATPTC